MGQSDGAAQLVMRGKNVPRRRRVEAEPCEEARDDVLGADHEWAQYHHQGARDGCKCQRKPVGINKSEGARDDLAQDQKGKRGAGDGIGGTGPAKAWNENCRGKRCRASGRNTLDQDQRAREFLALLGDAQHARGAP